MKRIGFAVLLLVSVGFFDNVSAKSFTDNGNETVTDNDSELIWQKGEGGSHTWEAALSYCESLSLGGNSDWRLPDIKELSSLVDLTIYNPSLSKTFFPGVNSSYYWSATTYASYVSFAWYVNFYDGSASDSYLGKTGPNYVRCVRAGQ